MKLGEILVRRGLITDKELLDALNAQLILGGHLGTCLIEQGNISEQQLGAVLAETFDVPWATTACFENIPLGVVETLTRAVVERHRVIPFRLEESGRLHVAMLEPSNLRSVDEISFAAGRKIAPWVAPEVRLVQAMDRYYSIARRMRFVTLAAQLDDSASKRPECQPATLTAGLGHDTSSKNSRSKSHAAVAGGTADVDAVIAAVLDTTSVCSSAVAGDATEDPLDDMAALLCRVVEPRKLGELVLEHTAPDVGRSLLFQIRKGNAVVWDWRGFDLTRSSASKVRLSLTAEPLFTLMLGDGFYRGPVPAEERFDSFYRALGIERPYELVLAPAYADDRLVALYYCDDGPPEQSTGLDHDTPTFRRIAKKLGLAINLIQIKQRLRTV